MRDIVSLLTLIATCGFGPRSGFLIRQYLLYEVFLFDNSMKYQRTRNACAASGSGTVRDPICFFVFPVRIPFCGEQGLAYLLKCLAGARWRG